MGSAISQWFVNKYHYDTLMNDYDVPVTSWVHLLYIVILFDVHYMPDP